MEEVNTTTAQRLLALGATPEEIAQLQAQARDDLLDEVLLRLNVDDEECDCSQTRECLKHRVRRLVELRSHS